MTFGKRLLDLLLATTGLLVLLPLLLLIGVLIRLDSPGPILFRQERIGQGNRVFSIYKFRSMVQNAAEIGPFYTLVGDPRVTRIGRFLRKTSLDELPQLLNVILGDMSLVGPRPITPKQLDQYTPAELAERHRVPPGITGLAQVNGRSLNNHEQTLNWDLQYVRNVSVLGDLRILWKTVFYVLSRRGTN